MTTSFRRSRIAPPPPLRTGLTTSPHLCTARERIIIDGEMISEQQFAALENDVAAVAGELNASFFERVVARLEMCRGETSGWPQALHSPDWRS